MSVSLYYWINNDEILSKTQPILKITNTSMVVKKKKRMCRQSAAYRRRFVKIHMLTSYKENFQDCDL